MEGLQILGSGNVSVQGSFCGSYRSSYASAEFFRGRHGTFEVSTSKLLKRIVEL